MKKRVQRLEALCKRIAADRALEKYGRRCVMPTDLSPAVRQAVERVDQKADVVLKSAVEEQARPVEWNAPVRAANVYRAALATALTFLKGC